MLIKNQEINCIYLSLYIYIYIYIYICYQQVFVFFNMLIDYFLNNNDKLRKKINLHASIYLGIKICNNYFLNNIFSINTYLYNMPIL